MAKFKKRHYWGWRDYNSDTGLYSGETKYHTDGSTEDWQGNTTREPEPSGLGMGRNDIDE